MPKVGTVDNFIGADIDIMATFAELLGVELEIRPITIPSYGELIPSLLRGEGDIVASSFSITDARLKLVEFSDPYFEARMAVVVLKGSKVKTFEDLSDKRAALTPGSSQEELMLARGFSSEQIRHTDFMRDSFLAVVEGDSDFTVVDAQLAERVSSEFKDAKIAFYMPGDSGYGFAVPKGSDLLKSLNLLIAKLKESGELKRIFDSYDIAR
ncbi:MAG: amino acid ABC transporter substrate-binding protein [bacterium]|nr:amino acid ABC transporter substrate-binding protein [bacterium]